MAFPKQPEREVTLPGRGALTGARLYAPEGPGPFSAALLSHTSGPLRQHIFEWAQRFLGVAEYAQGDVAAMRHLRSMPFVDGKRIVQMGFSYGAMAGLRAASEGFRTKYLGGERFAAIISVYPWCNEQFGPRYEDHQWNFYDDTTYRYNRESVEAAWKLTLGFLARHLGGAGTR